MKLLTLASERMRPLLRSRLLKNTSTLAIYLVVGYFVSVASSPVLSRLYSPEAFGLFGTFLVFPTTCLVFAALNFDMVAPSLTSETEAANVAAGAFCIATILATVLTFVYIAFIKFNVVGFGALPVWSAPLFFSLLVVWSFTSTSQYWCIRHQRFHAVGVGSVISNAARGVGQVGLALTGLGWLAMALGELIGRISNLLYYLYISRRDIPRLAPQVSFRGVVAALKLHRRFATVLLPPMAIDSVLSVVALPVITALFGLAAAGQYFLMKRMLDLPVSLTARTVSDAFYSRISDHVRESPDKIRPLLVRTFYLISGASTICFLPVLFFGPSLSAFVFGAPWRQAGLLAAIMVPGLVISLGAAPVARVFAVTELPGLRYVFTVANLVGITTTLVIAWVTHIGLVLTVVGLSLSQFLAYGVYFVSAYIAAGHVRG